MIEDNELRDFFAAFAMNGIMARSSMARSRLHPQLIPEEGMARRAYEVADAMLEARKQKEPEAGLAAIKTRRKKDE